GETFTIPKIRNITEEDNIKLPLAAQAAIGQGMGISPLSPLNEVQFDAFYLTESEQDEIQNKINTFNGYISAAANANSERLLLVARHAVLNQVIRRGNSHANIGLSASIAPAHGAFSVDGIHPKARTHAFITHLIIERIIELWGSNLHKVIPNA